MNSVARLIGGAGLIVALGACQASPEQKAYVRENLPAGCEVHDLGPYGGLIQLVVVTCEGRASTASNFGWRSGKTTNYGAAVWVQ